MAPRQGIDTIQTMETVLADSIARPKLDMAVLGIFGVVALVLRLGQRVASGVMVAAALLGGAWLAGILLW